MTDRLPQGPIVNGTIVTGTGQLVAGSGRVYANVSSFAPLNQQAAIGSCEAKFKALSDAVLYAYANDNLPIGIRLDVTDVAEPSIKALGRSRHERRGRRRERWWWILGLVGTAALSALIARFIP